MTAGSVAVPTVIPLRHPLSGRPKYSVDSNTKIELRTDTPNADIYYTINNTKPQPFQKIGERCTMKYVGPFTLPAGKQIVKAVAVAKSDSRESNVVTKIFEVDFVPPPTLPDEDDDLEFQDDLNRSRAVTEVRRAKSRLNTTPGSAWMDVDEFKSMQQKFTDMEVSGNNKFKPHSSARFSETRRADLHSPPSLYKTTIEQPYIFNGIGSQDLRWATDYNRQSLMEPTQQIQFDPKKYPRASDFLNFTTTSAGQYPGSNQWMPVNVSPSGFIVPAPQGMNGVADDISKPAKKITHNASSQTVGLFYPSQRQIDRTKEQEEEKLAFERQMRDRRPLLTAVSPGRGYWRKQVEHICQHLKAHTQNDAEFRALISEPKMGKLLTSAIQEDGYELSLTLTFALRGGKDPYVGKQLGVTRSEGYLSAHTKLDEQQMYSDEEETEEEVETARSTRSTGMKKIKKTKPKKKSPPKLSPLNAKLFKELGPNGRGDLEDVQQLLDEGADANCLNKNDLPPLHVAARNSKVDAIDALTNSGADVNAKGPSSIKGNTALHEAVNLGPSGMKVIDALLRAGADQTIKNDRGETAHDLSIKAGFESISKRFASALGQSQLQKMTRMRSY